jgi:hypothetical protein
MPEHAEMERAAEGQQRPMKRLERATGDGLPAERFREECSRR